MKKLNKHDSVWGLSHFDRNEWAYKGCCWLCCLESNLIWESLLKPIHLLTMLMMSHCWEIAKTIWIRFVPTDTTTCLRSVLVVMAKKESRLMSSIRWILDNNCLWVKLIYVSTPYYGIISKLGGLLHHLCLLLLVSLNSFCCCWILGLINCCYSRCCLRSLMFNSRKIL